MILIADSGSTKCDWSLIKSKDQLIEFSTMGFNPLFHGEELITSTLKKVNEVKEYSKQVEYVFYYGASNDSKENQNILERSLRHVFPNSKHIYSGHDLTGAALATYDGRPCISCILGTGSNACYFDGDVAKQENIALGYILGDEGSGSYFGKKILASYLYGKLPQHIHEAFEERYNLDKEEIIESVYVKPNANVYLASFMKFMSDFRDDPYIHEIISAGFFDFLSTHVMCYSNAKEVPVHFVGSVAFYFESELRQIGKNLDLTIGIIEKRPITGLVEYHLEKTLPNV